MYIVHLFYEIYTINTNSIQDESQGAHKVPGLHVVVI